MFQFRRFPTYGYLIHHTLPCGGFPHSEISGSQLICSSPKLIAAYHVLHRLLMPRHSPCALSCLTCPGGAFAPSFRSNFQSWSNFLVLLKFELCRLSSTEASYPSLRPSRFRAPSKAHSLRSVSSRFQTRLRWALKPGWKFYLSNKIVNYPNC